MRYLVISHGPMSKGSVESAEMILGKLSNVNTLSVTVDSTIDSMYNEIINVTSQYLKEEWVILTDILGGTPFNSAYRFLTTNDNAIIVAGFNLPLLLELFLITDKNLEEITRVVEEVKEGTITIVDSVVESEMSETEEVEL